MGARSRLILALALVLASFPACRSRGRGAPQRVAIGATLPLTGAEARIGGFYKEGYDLAVEQANQRGGLQVGDKRLPVVFTLLDDTSNQATAASLADRLINSDRVDFLLGTYASHLVQAQSAVAEQNKVPYVNGGGGATDIYRRGYKYLFGLLSPVELLGNTLMQWIDAQQKAGKIPRPAKIALLYEDTAHGKDFRKGVTAFVERSAGAYVVPVEDAFELNSKDFGPLLGKVKASGADLFLVDAHLPDYIAMHRQYVASGMCNALVSYGARGSEKAAVDALGQDNVNYILSAVWWSAQLAKQGGPAKEFVDAFQARYHREPEWFQALAYESARALFTAIEQAGSLDREAVRARLAALKMPSLLPGGTLEFPADHGQQAQNSFVVQQNMPDGTAPIVFPKEVATAAGVAPDPRCAGSRAVSR
jgi:branched-chain amino acid transport system substrate-binding protein